MGTNIISNLYGYVLLCAVLMGFEIILIGFIIAGRARSQVFNQQYMKTNFGQEHHTVTGNQIKQGGYPDNGSGFYSRNLSYAQWFKFNNAQRAHLNFVQWIASNLIFLLVAGLYFPIIAASIGGGIMLARLIYACGYNMSGPTGRTIGALLNDLCTLALFALAVLSSVYFFLGHQLPR